ncbi:MAG: CCA tRNA nucleotidyltransferase [Candidatus Bipolaricaulota bacterium]|nr:MAG: CCA tRNA nucleotidyltransferase [Candidatus Bipolaricaulota bacterium]
MRDTWRIDLERVYERHPFVREVLARLIDAGFEAVLVGGVVRDALLAAWEGRPFAPREVDVATAAPPDEILKLFSDRPIVRVGERFGVLRVVPPEGSQIEVATYREEGDYDGRRPAVVSHDADLEGDLRRRDLTVNALVARADGTVLDYVDGVPDLEARLLRAIGDPTVRFSEDYLRMLRAVRFASQLDATIEPQTAEAIRANAAHILEISNERIRDELLRLLESPRAAAGIERMDDLGLLPHVFPEVAALKGVPQPEEYHPEGDVYVHTVAALRVADRFITNPLVKLAVLLHDIGKPHALDRSGGANMGGHCAVGARKAERIAKRLRFSREEAQQLGFLIGNHMRVADFPAMGRGKQVRFVSEGEVVGEVRLERRFPRFFELLQLLVADCEASVHRATGWAPILDETLRVIEHIDEVCSLARARELIDGHALIAMGMPPGPRLGAVLAAVHDRILAGEITSPEEARRAAQAMIDDHPQRT